MRTVAQEGKGSLVKELEALCAAAQNWTLLKNHCEGRSLGTREIKGKGSQELFEVMGVK